MRVLGQPSQYRGLLLAGFAYLFDGKMLLMISPTYHFGRLTGTESMLASPDELFSSNSVRKLAPQRRMSAFRRTCLKDAESLGL